MFVILEAQRTEATYVADPSDDSKRAWLASQSVLSQLSLQLAKNKCFFLQQKHFEEGENAGHMLALLAKTQQSPSHIAAVTDAYGVPHYSTQAIIKIYRDFFKDVYTSKVQPSSDLQSFLDKHPLNFYTYSIMLLYGSHRNSFPK